MKELFLSLRAIKPSQQIQAIIDNGAQITNSQLMLQAFVQHYKFIFQAQPPSDAHWVTLDQCLGVVPHKISEAQKVLYKIMLTIEDLHEATMQMDNDKAPGYDGLPCEFYKTLWDSVWQEILQVYLEGFHNQSRGLQINKGNIKFIPKQGDLEKITCWQSITLLNVSYKIIVKA